MTQKYTISTGRSFYEKEWMKQEITWENLTKKLASCTRTAETFAEYQAMSKTDKCKAKDVGGFVGGTLSAPQRKAANMVSRSLITLDIDYGSEETLGNVELALDGIAWCVYSTHSHSPESKRFRLILPLSREVSPDEYIPIARRIADTLDIDEFDDSTYQPERLMFWPSASSDGEFVFRKGEGKPLDADHVLSQYHDWRDVNEWPVSSRVTRLSPSHGAKQEDPTQKGGVIGAFCRTYSISEAIEAFLSDVYEPTEHSDRYTFIEGTTAAGAIVYEDKWLFSHHGTDPCCEKEVNAFDLVRIHKFGDDDADAEPDTPVNRLPSFLKMSEFARAIPKVNGQMVKERLTAQEDFSDVEAPEVEMPENDWHDRLKMDKKGLVATPANYDLLLRNDERLKGAVKHDAFRDRNVLQRDLPWRKKEEDEYWKNSDDTNLITWISCSYAGSPVNKTVMLDAWDSVISQNSFHPVRDYLKALPEWDGKPRLDTLLSDYLGAVDCPLTRAMCRKHFVAAVSRVFHPGIKYDYVLTIVGTEGLGKSRFIRAMAGQWFDDSFSSTDVGSKEAMEQLRGRWIIEMGELKDYKKSTVESFKAFISKQDDSYRPAYGRKTEHYKRQCVFFATTNERSFLKGDTGNRRFWVVEVGLEKPIYKIDKDLTEAVRGQIWAEALVRMKEGEQLYLPEDLEMQTRDRQASYNEIATDDRIGVIASCIRRRLPQSWWQMNRKQRRDFYKEAADLDESAPFIRRETICAMEVQEEFFGQTFDRYRSKEINQIFSVLGFENLGSIRGNDKEYGQQRRYKIPASFYAEMEEEIR